MGSIAIRTWCFALFAGCLWPLIAAQAQPGNSLSAGTIVQFAPLRGQADRAVLYIGPESRIMEFPTLKKEEDLSKITCKYEVGADSINELINILEKGRVTVLSRPQRAPNARIGVYLYRGDKELSKLIFAEPYTGEGMRGTYNGDIPVISSLAFRSDLYEFARKHPIITKRYDCEEDGLLQ